MYSLFERLNLRLLYQRPWLNVAERMTDNLVFQTVSTAIFCNIYLVDFCCGVSVQLITVYIPALICNFCALQLVSVIYFKSSALCFYLVIFRKCLRQA